MGNVIDIIIKTLDRNNYPIYICFSLCATSNYDCNRRFLIKSCLQNEFASKIKIGNNIYMCEEAVHNFSWYRTHYLNKDQPLLDSFEVAQTPSAYSH